jgi:hypothetical protein
MKGLDFLERVDHSRQAAMAAQSADAMEPHRASLPKGAHVRVIRPGSGQARSKKSRKQGGRKR